MKPSIKYIQYLTIVLLTFCCMSAEAQQVFDFKRNADRYFDNGDYYSAVVYYEKYLENNKAGNGASTEPYTIQSKGTGATRTTKNTKREDVVYRVAESYRYLHNYAQAEKWYAEAVTNNNNQLASLWYGISLKANGKFENAEKAIQQFLDKYKQQDQYAELAKKELASIQFVLQQQKKDISLFKLSSLGVNSGSADYAASVFENGLVFTSSRPDSSLLNKKNKNPYINKLYQTAGGTTSAIQFSIPVTEGMEQGTPSFSKDGNTAFFTQWTKKSGKNISAIYMSQKQNGSWSQPELLNESVNQSGYSSKEPYVTADGNYLFFASDKPGGNGNFDLYVATLNATQVGKSVNLGKTINTKDDDLSPFYHQATETLVFATNGRVGMGGFDLFTSKGSPFKNNWQSPENMGYPVNSIKDDLYFQAKQDAQLMSNAIMSSDRSSECCLQLFAVDKTYRKYLAGIVTDCKTGAVIPDAVVQLSKPSGQVLSNLNTSPAGSYLFERNNFEALQITANKEGYNNNSISVTEPSDKYLDTLKTAAICLTPVEPIAKINVTPSKLLTPGEPKEKEPEEVLEEPQKPKELSALFDFSRYDLKSETGNLMDTLSAILKRESKLGVEVYGYTDKVGTPAFNLELSRKRAEACKAYLMQKGVKASRIKVTAMGECCPLRPETKPNGKDDPEARKLNRRVEFKITLLQL